MKTFREMNDYIIENGHLWKFIGNNKKDLENVGSESLCKFCKDKNCESSLKGIAQITFCEKFIYVRNNRQMKREIKEDDILPHRVGFWELRHNLLPYDRCDLCGEKVGGRQGYRKYFVDAAGHNDHDTACTSCIVKKADK